MKRSFLLAAMLAVIMLANISSAGIVLELVGQIVTPGSAYGVAVSGDYVCVADYHNGMQVYDVSDSENPTQVGHVDADGDAVDVYIQGNYAYLSAGNSLKIINIFDPANPITEGSFPTTGYLYSTAVVGNYAYLAAGTAGLRIVDISTPSEPAFIGEYNTPGEASGVCIHENKAYVAGYNYTLQIIDVSTPTNPLLLATFDTTSIAQRGVTVRDDYAYVCNYSNGLQIVDVSDPYNPLSAASFITESAYDVELYNDYAFITSYYTGASLKVVNISDPLNPALEWSRTIAGARGITIADDKIYVVNRTSLLIFKDVSYTANSSICGTVTDNPGSFIEGIVVQIANNYIYRSDTTDINGNYCLTSIPEGAYDISFSHPDYCDEVLQDIQVDPDDTSYANIVMDVGEITGIITGSDLVPIQGAIVRAKYTNVIDTSDINGNYSLHILCSGTYKISVTHPDYCARTFTDIQVDPSDTTNFDIVLYEATEIYGTITNLEMEPFQGISVTVVELRIRDYSDENGQYNFADICPGIYNIEIEGPQNCYILYENVTVDPETPFQLNVMIGNNSTISGTVKGPDMLPLQGVIVSVLGTSIADTTDSNGQYSLINLYPSIYYMAFQLDGYWYPGNNHFVIGNNENIEFNASMCLGELFEPLSNTAYFWAGGNFDNCSWYDTVIVSPNQWVEIPIYFMGDPNVYVENLSYPLGCKQALLDTIDVNGGQLFWPLTDWGTKGFFNYNYDDTPPPSWTNPPGYISYSFQGFSRYIDPGAPLLHSEIPTHFMSFRVHAINNSFLIGTSHCDAMIAGMDLVGGPSNCGDTTGSFSYPMDLSYACVTFGGAAQFTTLSGLVNDMYGEPVESVHVAVEGVPIEYGEYCTGPDGYYSVIADYGDRTITFNKIGYVEAVYENYEMAIAEQILNVTLYPVAEEETVFWFGNLDGSPVSASIGRKLYINIYAQSSSSAYGGDIHIPLALEQQYFDSLVSASSGSYYYPFTEWETAGFEGPYGAPPNPAGWVSESFIAEAGSITPAPWLHMAAPTKILTFAAYVIDNPLLDGTTVPCLAVGAHPESLPMAVGDTLTGDPYSNIVHISELTFTLAAPDYPYLPGDVNMWGGAWPPSARGGDVTYLVNFFRSVPTSHPCFLDGFWASADINGDCLVIGSDVTKLVNCFRGLTEKSYCQDYPPAWLTPADLPEEMPTGWPGCE